MHTAVLRSERGCSLRNRSLGLSVPPSHGGREKQGAFLSYVRRPPAQHTDYAWQGAVVLYDRCAFR